MKRKIVFGSLFVVLLLVGAYAAYAVSQPKLVESTVDKSPKEMYKGLEKSCEPFKGRVITMDFLVGFSKNIVISTAQGRLSKSQYLKKEYGTLDFSEAFAGASLLKVNNEMIRREVVVIPKGDKTAIVYIRDSKTTNNRIPKEITVHEEVLIVGLNTTTKSFEVKTRIYPMDGFSPVCSDTPCSTDSDCPDRSSEGLFFPSCGENNCKTCSNWDYACVYKYGIEIAACASSCLGCSNWSPSCLFCLVCALDYLSSSLYAECCRGEVVSACHYYEWWD